MKRSQMILEIVGQLQDHDKNYNRISFSEWKQKAEKVLTLIENSGMLPPNNGTFSTSRHSDDALLYVNEVYEWEPEDG